MADKKKEKLEHIQVKDNGIKLSQKIGDELSDAKAILENKVTRDLIQDTNKSLAEWQIRQNLKLKDFKEESSKVVKATTKKIKNDLKKDSSVNLTKKQTLEITTQMNNGLIMLQRSAVDAYRETIKKTSLTLRVEKASILKDALAKHLRSGLKIGVVYQDGKEFKFDNYWEMKARTDIQQDIGNNMVKTGQENGVIFYIAAYFGDCAKDHVDYQGKIYYDEDWESKAPKDRIDEIRDYINSKCEMSVQDVMTDKGNMFTTRPNCRHYFQYIDIDSVLGAKTNDDVNKLRAERNLNFNGKYKPEKYKALQKQRLNERNIRAEKEEVAKQEAMLALYPGDKEIQSKILRGEARIRQIQANQRELINQNSNLVRDYDREQVGIRANLGANPNQTQSVPTPQSSNETPPIATTSKTNLVSDEKLLENVGNHFNGETKIISEFVKKANTKDVNVNKILANVDKLPSIKISKAKRSSYNGNNGIALSSQKDAGVAFHEFGHSLDHQVAYDMKWEKENRKFHWISDDIDSVRVEAKNNMNNTIPQDFMDKMKEQTTVIQDAVKNDIEKIRNNVISNVQSTYGGKLPYSMTRQIIEQELTKEVQKSYLKYANSNQEYKQWSCLSDIYDAITDGNATNSKGLTGSHGYAYYHDVGTIISFTTTGNVKKQNTEIFANFCEMKMGNYTEQLDYFKKDQPKLYDALEERFAFVAQYLEDK